MPRSVCILRPFSVRSTAVLDCPIKQCAYPSQAHARPRTARSAILPDILIAFLEMLCRSLPVSLLCKHSAIIHILQALWYPDDRFRVRTTGLSQAISRPGRSPHTLLCSCPTVARTYEYGLKGLPKNSACVPELFNQADDRGSNMVYSLPIS